MTVEQHRFPRGMLHPPCSKDLLKIAAVPHNTPTQTCEQKDEMEAWALVVNRAAVNAAMLVEKKHTKDDFVWTFDREKGA